jgi:endonuclease YncB( thermonuclease family)
MTRLETLASALLVETVVVVATPAKADDFVGQASIIDGDTIGIHNARIRLWGIDAPENTQFCRGEESSSIAAEQKRRMRSTSLSESGQ